MTRVALFVAGLAGLFLGAMLLGQAVDVDARTVADAHTEDAPAHGGGHPAATPVGLSVEQDGYRLVAERETLVAGRAEPFVFRILDPAGDVLRDYDVEHERLLHLIVVSRPLGHFLHGHPQLRPDGAWAVTLRLPVNGSYRVYADFTSGGERRALALDVQGHSGPSVAETQASEYDVALHRHGDRLEFDVRRAGSPVELQPYLGARGHLVVLREGDLAYVHAHADEDRLSFDVPFPGAGRYRLFLEFKVGDTVETVPLRVTR